MEGTFNVAERDTYGVTLYTNTAFTQSPLSRAIKSKLHFRVQHSDNKVFSVGFEDFDPLSNSHPTRLSLWNLYGTRQADFKAFGGYYVAYDTNLSFVPFYKLLAGFKHSQVTAFLQANVNRTRVTTTIDPSLGIKTTNVVNDPEISLTVDTKPRSDLKVFGDANYNVTAESLDVGVGTEYLIEQGTRVKGRVANDKSLVLSLIHNYRNTINFAMVAKVKLNIKNLVYS